MKMNVTQFPIIVPVWCDQKRGNRYPGTCEVFYTFTAKLPKGEIESVDVLALARRGEGSE